MGTSEISLDQEFALEKSHKKDSKKRCTRYKEGRGKKAAQ